MAEEVQVDLNQIAQAVETAGETAPLANLFTARTTAPGSDNAYYFADNPYSQGGYGLQIVPPMPSVGLMKFWELLRTAMGNANSWWAYNQSTGYYP